MAVLRPFRFWVQNVLPQVYDDSLSYYELLNKVVDKLNEVIGAINGTNQAFEELLVFVNEYFNSTEFSELVDKKLDEMAEDGTLDSIVNKYNMFVPSDSDKDSYLSGTLSAIASWLVNEVDSDSIVNPSDAVGITLPFYARYNDTGKSYDTLFQKYSQQNADTFVRDDTYNDKPIVYMNCACMLSTITKGRDYVNSAPYYGATAQSYDEEVARSKCLEVGNSLEKPWTIDFLNNCFSGYMGEIMDKSGCTLRLLYDGDRDEIKSDVLNTLETGDFVFFARPNTHPEAYKGIVHCSYYIKSMSDMDKAGEPYNVKFKPVPDNEYGDQSLGSIFHCHGATSGLYANVLRIETLKAAIYRRYPGANVWVCKPYSNSLNSNKAARKVNGVYKFGDNTYFGVTAFGNADTIPAHGADYDDNNRTLYIERPALVGRVASGSGNLNELTDGIYYINNLSEWTNHPSTVNDEEIVLFQFGQATEHKIQLAFEVNSGRIIYRQRKGYLDWGDWKVCAYNVIS